MHPITWLIILVLFGIGEAVTVGLTSIWFALGALGALIVSQLGLGFWPQITTFIVLSALSMLLVRPFAKKFLRPGYSATNADRIIGATGLVTEEIDNLARSRPGEHRRTGMERPQHRRGRRDPRGPGGPHRPDPGRQGSGGAGPGRRSPALTHRLPQRPPPSAIPDPCDPTIIRQYKEEQLCWNTL